MKTIVAVTDFKHQHLSAFAGVPYCVDDAASEYFVKLGWAKPGEGPAHVVAGLTVDKSTVYGDTGQSVLND